MRDSVAVKRPVAAVRRPTLTPAAPQGAGDGAVSGSVSEIIEFPE
jgi:hypothetical protein